jgi:hypothetical protein
LTETHQTGQAMVETLIVVFLTLLILLGIVQFGLIFNAKTTLNYAAFEAARSGALNYADKQSIEFGLARGLSPLYTSVNKADGVFTRVAKVQDARDQALEEIRDGEFVCIERINPPAVAFSTPLAVNDPTGNFPGTKLIPNDHLLYRTKKTYNNLSVQDANLLKLRVTYCYPMVVPIISSAVQQLTGTSPRSNAALATGQSVNTPTYGSVTPAGNFQQNCYAKGRFPIVAQAIVRMHTPVKNDVFPLSCD